MNPISRISRFAALALPALTLMACADTHVDRMNRANLNGSDPFTSQLARNYKDLSNYEAYQMYDWPDAVNYADKAMAAGRGQVVQPEDPSRWHIKGTDKQTELLAARQRLMAGLANGSVTRVPVDAAYAQSNYDCWVEQQAEGWQFDHIEACKNGFLRAIQVVETRQTTQTVQPAAQGPFLVFFDWDKSTLTADAQRVLDQIVQRERNTTEAIHLIGHADRSGPDNYNMKLSQRRADSTKAYLVAHGIAANRITTEARGERDPLVATADGVREPQNRRVAINLLTRLPGA